MNRRKFLQSTTALAGGGLLPMLKFLPAEAAGKNSVLVVVTGFGPNSMDIQRKGTNRPSYAMAVNLYDRLVSYGVKKLSSGAMMYDYKKIVPELATSWTVSKDGKSYVFKLRKDATFWDGTPVTADDVKWSFDRAVSLGGFPAVQMRAGSMTKPEQFSVIDKHTFKITLPVKSKLTLPDLGVPVPIVINSKVAKAHATKEDPWATEYLHKNPAGGGAFMLERWDPGQQVIYKRFENWKNGKLPAVEKVVIREVPSASTRRALLERGDVDVSLDLPAKDAKELSGSSAIKVDGVPIENCLHALGMNLKFGPFKDKRVRQAVAYALPYQKIFEGAAYGRGVKMWGAKFKKPKSTAWPQPFPYDTNLVKAKALLKQAGYDKGFEVPISYNLGLAQWTEPTALLIQESLAKIGIKCSLNKIPGANWRTKAMVEKGLELHLKNFGGWLNYPDYYFYWVYQDGRLFNSMNYKNPEVEKLVDTTLHMSTKDPKYGKNVKRLIEIAFDDVPLVPLWQPYLDVAMRKDISGYQYWFHRQLDCRTLKKT